jgi:predicted RNA methylase
MAKELIEQYSEHLVLGEMGIMLGENAFGNVYPQGNIIDIPEIEECLNAAGGKPDFCELDDCPQGSKGQAKPEFIITFNDCRDTIIVVECKSKLSLFETEAHNRPKKYAVDGVLYYAKYLKHNFNVIAIGFAGTKAGTYRAEAYYWAQNQDEPTLMPKARDVLLEPVNYIKLIRGEKIQRQYSLEQIRATATKMNNTLRAVKMPEKSKPIFIAGILIALTDSAFVREYDSLTTFNSVANRLLQAIDEVLENSDIPRNKVNEIKASFRVITRNPKLKSIPLGKEGSIIWYIKQLEMKIKPMMEHSGSAIDALGEFYHEFIRYTGGDGAGLGIVLTPQHLTEFMVRLADVSPEDKILDPCCGTASFLVTSMSMMINDATADQIDKIRHERLYGIELDSEIYVLAIANMIVRGDGKSNIYHEDCFDEKIITDLKGKGITVGLINPPYSQNDKEELEFVEHLLDIVQTHGVVVCVVPMSCALGTRFKDTRKRLFKNHTLKAVFSMPDDIFYPTASNIVCVMVWEAHVQHDSTRPTFFGYYKDDGYVKAKKLGRIDKYDLWRSICEKWLNLYRERDVIEGLTAKKCVTDTDEWCCEAHMETDYSDLTQDNFQKTVSDYYAYIIASSIPSIQQFLDKQTWKKFRLGDLFDVLPGKRLIKGDMTGGALNFIGSIDTNNGVTEHIEMPALFQGNTITVNYNGSVGESFYQKDPYWASDDVKTLIPKGGWTLNKYTALFICTVIKQERYRFNYGRKWITQKIESAEIILPTTSAGNPDWTYMENYIRSLPYSDMI